MAHPNQPNTSPGVGDGEPLALTEKQRILCDRLDQLYVAAGRTGSIPSELFRGALCTIQLRARNPDWMAQSAHSLRELLYPFDTKSARRDALSRYGAAGDADALSKDIWVHYGFMTNVAHHNWDGALKNPFVKTASITNINDRVAVYEAALFAFEDVLFQALRRQLAQLIERHLS